MGYPVLRLTVTALALLLLVLPRSSGEWVTISVGDDTQVSFSNQVSTSVLTEGRETRVSAEESAYASSLPKDSDGDALLDLEEIELGTDPLKADSDGDGLRDGIEVLHGLSPCETSTFSGEASDAEIDLDEDGFSNLDEQTARTNLTDPSSYPGAPRELGVEAQSSFVWRKVMQ